MAYKLEQPRIKRQPSNDPNIFGPPPYSLKYKDKKRYKEDMEMYEARAKVWNIICDEPKSKEDTEMEIDTLKEYLAMKERWRNGKKNKGN